MREFVRKLVFDTSYINIVINLNMYEKVKQKDNKDQKGKRNHISYDTLFCNYGHTDKGVDLEFTWRIFSAATYEHQKLAC